MPNGSIPAREKPAAERTGLRRRGAALRPGRLRAAGRCATEFAAKHLGDNWEASTRATFDQVEPDGKARNRTDG